MTTPADDQMCYACGPRNPVGLHLVFGDFADGTFGTEFVPRREHQGYKGIVHGGFLSLVMDEAMVACLHRDGIPVVSAELTVRLLKPVAPGERLRVTARHGGDPGPRVTALAETVRLTDGATVARAKSACLRLPLPAAGQAAGQAAGHAPLCRGPHPPAPEPSA